MAKKIVQQAQKKSPKALKTKAVKKEQKAVAVVVKASKKVDFKKVVSKKRSVVSGVKKSSKKLEKKVVKLTPKKGVDKSTKKTRSVSSGQAASMKELLERKGYEFKVPKKGAVVEGVVTEVSRRMVLVDIGAKTEGMVVDKEYEAAHELIKDIAVGDKLRAFVVSPENDRGQILLSLKKEATDRAWELYAEMMETGETLMVKGLEVNKGGLIVRTNGTRGFIPSSQFGKKLANRIDELVDRPIKVKVIEVDREKNRLIFSERHVSEADVLERKTDALKEVKEGDMLEGIVSGVMPFGAFVTVSVAIKGKKEDVKVELDGLVHISEISWEKVNDPNEYFKKGQKVNVRVLSIDHDAGKLNLSVKRLANDPWQEIEKKYKAGSKHTGQITRVEAFGSFVNFEPGVDGLIHISKIPAGEEPKVGDKIDVFVETVDPENRRMSLSLVLKTTEKLMYK